MDNLENHQIKVSIYIMMIRKKNKDCCNIKDFINKLNINKIHKKKINLYCIKNQGLKSILNF